MNKKEQTPQDKNQYNVENIKNNLLKEKRNLNHSLILNSLMFCIFVFNILTTTYDGTTSPLLFTLFMTSQFILIFALSVLVYKNYHKIQNYKYQSINDIYYGTETLIVDSVIFHNGKAIISGVGFMPEIIIDENKFQLFPENFEDKIKLTGVFSKYNNKIILVESFDKYKLNIILD